MSHWRCSHTSLLAVAGLAVFAAGVLHYVVFRDISQTLFGAVAAHWPGVTTLAGDPSVALSLWAGAAPTFFHVIACTLLSWAVVGLHRTVLSAVPLCWTGLNLILEAGQLRSLAFWQLPGTFDGYDIGAAILGGVVVFGAGFALSHPRRATPVPDPLPWYRKLAAVVVVPFGLLSITASFEWQESYYEPIYMSYAELRAAVKTEPTRPLTKLGKIYTYQQWLLVNEPNQGIHLYDNSDPAQPRYHAFIVVPGNVDIAVRDGYIYADSYVDLATIDLNDAANIREVNRVADVFPYDPYQNISDDILLDSVDPAKGVVVGYQLSYRNVDNNDSSTK